MKRKLTFETVPEECWYSNLRSALSAEQWDIVRKDAYRRYRYRCAICGASGRMEAHEKWSYDISSAVQKLEDVIALCHACHQVKHISRTQLMGKGAEAEEHYMRVNGCTQSEYHADLQALNEHYRALNAVENWITDLTFLREKYGFLLRIR